MCSDSDDDDDYKPLDIEMLSEDEAEDADVDVGGVEDEALSSNDEADSSPIRTKPSLKKVRFSPSLSHN